MQRFHRLQCPLCPNRRLLLALRALLLPLDLPGPIARVQLPSGRLLLMCALQQLEHMGLPLTCVAPMPSLPHRALPSPVATAALLPPRLESPSDAVSQPTLLGAVAVKRTLYPSTLCCFVLAVMPLSLQRQLIHADMQP